MCHQTRAPSTSARRCKGLGLAVGLSARRGRAVRRVSRVDVQGVARCPVVPWYGRLEDMATPELGPAERERLFQRFGRSYASGEAIYGEGEPAEHCFLLHRGRVRVVKRVRGVERSLAVIKPGDVFGEDALLERTRRTASALALTEVEVLALDRAMFGILIAGNPEVAGRILEQLVRRLRYADEQLENAMLPDPPSRVINTLIRSATELESGPEGIVVPISPLELASRGGLDVDTVRKVIQQLRDTGYLRIVEERIVLPDLDALRQLHELLGRKENVRRGLP